MPFQNIETYYRGCRFESRIEARWAVFFETLGIKWWYEPEGYKLRFDYEEFAAGWDMTEDELLQEGVPQAFQHLDGKEYKYLPDFYLPELHVWVEIKGPNPTREEIEKAFLLGHMVSNAARGRIDEARTEAERRSAWNDASRQGVFIIYGDIPWPFPQKGNIFGYGASDSGSTFSGELDWVEGVAEKFERKATEYRSLLMGRLKLCWQECPLCLKIGVGEIGSPYCGSCHDQVAKHIWDHLARYRVMSEAGNQDVSDQVFSEELWRLYTGVKSPNPANVKAMQLTKGLMNPEFFTSGHKSPRLREAYSAARSAKWGHGKSP